MTHAMQLKFRRLLLLGLVLFWAALLVLTHLPPSQLGTLPRVMKPQMTIQPDKIFHFCAYLVLTMWYCAWSWLGRQPRWREVVFILLGMLAYGAVEELSQGPFGRTPDVKDWLADVLGAGLGIVLIMLVWKLVPSLGRLKQQAQSTQESIELLDHVAVPQGFHTKFNNSVKVGDSARSGVL